ncbi:MAG: polysaccharide biosynthesis protein [Hyphomicrobiales bacterium]|nr:polysaccharide biosynthesis protein [Hyphomicrobiales bacterium]
MIERLRTFASELSRPWKRVVTISFDVVALIFVQWLAYQLRLGGPFIPSPTQFGLMALAPIIAVPIFIRMGLYRAVIRYLPERAIIVIAQAMLLATVVWVAVLFLTELYAHASVPRSIPVLFFTFGTLVIGASRIFVKRVLAGHLRDSQLRGQVLIYGADHAGIQLASALNANGSRHVAGFVDDDPGFHGRDIMGIRVFGPGALGDLVRNLGISEIILSIPSLTVERRKEIHHLLSAYPVRLRTLPAITDLAAGKYDVGVLRQIDIDDLLGRSSVPADPELLRSMIAGRVILVSGAGGSIGSELVRLIARWSPKTVVLLEANEFALYEIGRHVARETAVPLVSVLGSVTDADLVRRVLEREAVEVVFHAAAHKHVPLLEINALEGVRNNVIGTYTLANAALAAGVSNFVLISTDKAVHPSSVMGATKRWAELIVHQCAEIAATKSNRQRFCAVRFGNVLGSNGSVVPLFKEQIAGGGPITVTDNRMTRYFMSLHEAAELIVQAGSLSQGGDTFLLEMGEPIAVRELAENMIGLAGLTVRSSANPTGDIEIKEIGIRPGEKLEEQLFYDPAAAIPTQQPKILRANQRDVSAAAIDKPLAELSAALRAQDEPEVRRILFTAIQLQA